LFGGIFINLDRSLDRRLGVERELARARLAERYRRLSAVDGATVAPLPPLLASEVGCNLSHRRALTLAAEQSVPTHIIEDDVALSVRLRPTVEAAIQTGLLDRYDIVFLDVDFLCWTTPDIWQRYRQAQSGGTTIVDLTGAAFFGMNSYLVSPASARKLADVCARAMERFPRPIDILVRDETRAGRIKSVALFPFVTTLRLDHADRSLIGSTQRGQCRALDLATNVMRYSFFVDADPAYAAAFLDIVRREIQSEPDRDSHKQAKVILDFLATPVPAGPAAPLGSSASTGREAQSS
jgi:GR25 family glycosyltransferase involved in LPS biosynthesis